MIPLTDDELSPADSIRLVFLDDGDMSAMNHAVDIIERLNEVGPVDCCIHFQAGRVELIIGDQGHRN